MPAADKRRRLNELLAVQEAIGLERNEAWLGREVEVLVDAVHAAARPRARRDRAGGRRAHGSPAGRAATSSSTSPATRRSSGARSWSASTTPARTRCEARSSERDRAAPPLIVIAGATATGKTELAIRLAEAVRAGGRPVAIISADSRQVFRGLDIGTAKVDAADRARVPHLGLDLVDPDEPFSVADFAAHARGVLADLARDGGVAILAGGTGLYLRAVGRGLDTDALPSDPALRARLEADADRRRPAGVGRRGSRTSPRRSRQASTRATRAASSAPSRSPSSAATARRRRRAATRARSPGSG